MEHPGASYPIFEVTLYKPPAPSISSMASQALPNSWDRWKIRSTKSTVVHEIRNMFTPLKN